MSEITDRMLKMTGRKFPTRNVIKGTKGVIPVGQITDRVIDNHIVTLVLGIYNVTILNAVEIKEE